MENNMNFSPLLSSTLCQDIDALLKSYNASLNESRNMTPESVVKAFYSLHCIPKRYLGPQGINKWIVSIISVIFLVFGLIGNILSATIMYRRARRGLSSYFYLALLAIVDICVLYTGCLSFLFQIAFDYHLQLQGPIYCRLEFYVQHLFTYISAWLIVAVTFERFIVVRFPFQSILICRMRVAYTITLIIVVFFSIYTAHCFFTLEVTSISIRTEQGYHPEYPICELNIYQDLLSALDLCFYSLIPSILIIIFNILIILTMFYAIKQRRYYLQASSYLPTTNTCPRNLNQKTKSSSSIRTPFFRSRSVESTPARRSFTSHRQSYQHRLNKTPIENKSQQVLFDSTSATGIRLTCLLLIISFIFVLCTLPICMQSLLAGLTAEYRSTTRWQITRICLTLLMYLNHTINFVFYCLTGRAFRNECQKILCGLWALKDIHVSCTINPDPDKHHHYHHQQMILTDHHHHRIIPSGQQKRMKRSYM